MPNEVSSVTCSERAKMNAIAGIAFIVAGDGILLVALMRESGGGFGQIVTALFGAAAIIMGFYYMLCFINKKITVTDKGVIFSNWTGKASAYDWDEASVSFHPGRNAYFTFMLGKKKVVFYGYATNAAALYDYLYDNERFDNDTMRQIERERERQEERIRDMQRRAREHGVPVDDDDEDDRAD